MKIVCIYDKKAMTYQTPFAVPSVVTASRELDRVVNGGKGDFADFPEDFALYHLADFNEVTGETTPNFPPRLLHELTEFIKTNKQ